MSLPLRLQEQHELTTSHLEELVFILGILVHILFELLVPQQGHVSWQHHQLTRLVLILQGAIPLLLAPGAPAAAAAAPVNGCCEVVEFATYRIWMAQNGSCCPSTKPQQLYHQAQTRTGPDDLIGRGCCSLCWQNHIQHAFLQPYV